MRAPVELPRQEGPGESPLEEQLGHLLSFDPGPDLADQVIHLELGAVRAAGGPGPLAPAGDQGSADRSTAEPTASS